VEEFDSYFATRRYSDLALRPDGDEVAYATDITGTYQAWRQSAEGGWPYQLTAFEDRAVRRVAWCPAGERLALAADRQGDENEQIFLLPRGGGRVTRLTSRDEVRHMLGEHPWSPDGKLLACSCNADDPANMDLTLIDVETGAMRRLSRSPHFHHAICWSRRGDRLAAIVAHGRTHQDVVVADVKAREMVPLTFERPAARRMPIGFSADGDTLYLLTDEEREFQGLARYDMKSKSLEWIKTPEWDIDVAVLSSDARWICYVVNEDAVHRIHLLDRNSGMEPILPALGMGKVVTLSIAADGSRAALLHDAAVHAPEVVVYDLPRGARRQITDGMVGGVPEEEMVEPEIVRYPSFDRKIPAHLYRPKGKRPAKGSPALLFIHGGPEVQEQPFYRPLFQFLVHHGFFVLAPNIRGSRGYGKSYQKLVLRDFGGADLKDLEAAARHLRELPGVDPERIAVAGGSYGGFMALLCATRLPEYWAAAIDVCGFTNLATYARSVPQSWQRFMRNWVGDPSEREDELRERSPLSYLDQLRCPLLVIQGARNPRVPRTESDQLVASIREQGGSVDYLVFEDEGHDFLKRENRLRAYRAVAEFLLRHLG